MRCHWNILRSIALPILNLLALERSLSSPNYRFGLYALLLSLTLGWPTTASSAAEAGRLGHSPVRHFTPEIYGGGDQIFDLERSPNGTLFFADPDESKVHRYDGARWTSIQLPRSPLSLAAGKDGRIWVGCGGDLGVLEEIGGRLEYRSLADLLPPGIDHPGRFTDVAVSPRGPIFASDSLFVFEDDRFTVLEAPDGGWFSHLTSDRGRFFAATPRGLYELEGDQLVLLWESGTSWVEGVAVLDSGRLLIASRGATSSLSTVGDGLESPFSEQAATIFEEVSIGPLRRLVSPGQKGRFAVGTIGQGVLIIDGDGRLLENADTANGLGSDEIYGLVEDSSGTLWTASERGISAIHLLSATTSLSRREGVPYGITGVERIGGDLFVTALSGLYRLSRAADGSARFAPVSGFAETDTWDVGLIDQKVYAINDDGVFEVNEERRRVYHPGPLAFVDTGRANLVMLVGNRRLEMARMGEDGWQRLYRYDLPGYGASGLEERRGVYWIRSTDPVLFRVEFSEGLEKPPEVTRFRPDRDWYGIDFIAGELTAWGEDGVFRLQGADSGIASSWQIDSRFSTIDWPLAIVDPVFVRLLEDLRGGLWIAGRAGLNRYTLEEGVFVAQGSVGLTASKIDGIFVDAEEPEVLWVSTPEGLLRYPFVPQGGSGRVRPSAGLILRRVSPGTEWTVHSEGRQSSDATQLAAGPYTLRFEYALPAFEIADYIEFRSRLEGLEEDWGVWSLEAQRDLMNIPPGNYRFRVQARHLGQSLGEAEYAFRILPPWYRTRPWKIFYFVLGLVLLVAVFFLQRVSARRKEQRLEHDIEVLEELVAQRTKGLEGLSRRLESMAVTDPLTGLPNRRFLQQVLPGDLAQAQRDHDPTDEQGHCLVLLLLDLDHFKKINDRYGHAGGDAVLREAGALLSSTLRRSDYVTRIGGEEFAIVVRSTERHKAAATAARVVEAFRNHDFSSCFDEPRKVTCSVGFVAYPLQVDHDPGDIEQVMAIADACLYRAKNSGRDSWAGALDTRRLPELTMGPNGLETMINEGDLELVVSGLDEGLPVEVVS